jgi:hypothetical protein
MTVQGHGWDDNVGYPAFRNVIINGGMSVAQRGTSVASVTGNAYNTADRWTTYINTLGTWTNSVETDAPTGSGLTKSSKMLCTTANASPAAGAYAQLTQPIEGQNLQHFAKGTASAKQFALSFWVKTNVTGTYIVELTAGGRAVSASYTISTSATWEKKTIIFPADAVTSIVNDNTVGLYCAFMLGAGSTYTSGTLQTTWAAIVSANRYVGQVNLAAATSNYWQITGVQLEAGSVATPFEFEPFETTLRKCQRYYEKSYSLGTVPGTNTNEGSFFIWNSTQSDSLAGVHQKFAVNKRAKPTTILYWTPSGTAGSWDYLRSGTGGAAAVSLLDSGETGFNAYHNVGAANTTCRSAGHWTASAEL